MPELLFALFIFALVYGGLVGEGWEHSKIGSDGTVVGYFHEKLVKEAYKKIGDRPYGFRIHWISRLTGFIGYGNPLPKAQAEAIARNANKQCPELDHLVSGLPEVLT